MDEPKSLYFISYSRKQSYLAETLVIQLENADFSIWFDVQQLTPGVRWEAAIDDGLRNCAGVVLIASQAALASPYVEKEWANVQDNGKRVCVCVVEDVDLPERLRRPDVMIIDVRGRYDASVTRLIDFLNGKTIANDREKIHSSRWLGMRWAVPRPILRSIIFWRGVAILSWFEGLLIWWQRSIFPICAYRHSRWGCLLC